MPPRSSAGPPGECAGSADALEFSFARLQLQQGCSLVERRKVALFGIDTPVSLEWLMPVAA